MRRSFRSFVVALLVGTGVVACGPVRGRSADDCTLRPACRTCDNLGELKAAAVAYHDSGRYMADVARVAADAEDYVGRRADHGGHLAIVLDIDETALTNWPELREQDFGFSIAAWNCWVGMSRAEALPSVLELYPLLA